MIRQTNPLPSHFLTENTKLHSTSNMLRDLARAQSNPHQRQAPPQPARSCKNTVLAPRELMPIAYTEIQAQCPRPPPTHFPAHFSSSWQEHRDVFSNDRWAADPQGEFGATDSISSKNGAHKLQPRFNFSLCWEKLHCDENKLIPRFYLVAWKAWITGQ